MGFDKKVFSPVLFADRFIISGFPYECGWTFRKRYTKALQRDTVKSGNSNVFYYYWPVDTIKLYEY